jgi:hypothetical protein
MFNRNQQKNDHGRCEIGKKLDQKGDCTFDSLFESDWEVFVIKRDETTGQLVGKTACCALAKV